MKHNTQNITFKRKILLHILSIKILRHLCFKSSIFLSIVCADIGRYVSFGVPIFIPKAVKSWILEWLPSGTQGKVMGSYDNYIGFQFAKYCVLCLYVVVNFYLRTFWSWVKYDYSLGVLRWWCWYWCHRKGLPSPRTWLALLLRASVRLVWILHYLLWLLIS